MEMLLWTVQCTSTFIISFEPYNSVEQIIIIISPYSTGNECVEKASD